MLLALNAPRLLSTCTVGIFVTRYISIKQQSPTHLCVSVCFWTLCVCLFVCIASLLCQPGCTVVLRFLPPPLFFCSSPQRGIERTRESVKYNTERKQKRIKNEKKIQRQQRVEARRTKKKKKEEVIKKEGRVDKAIQQARIPPCHTTCKLTSRLTNYSITFKGTSTCGLRNANEKMNIDDKPPRLRASQSPKKKK